MGTISSRLTVVEQDGEASRPLIADLAAAVYPPSVLATVPWRFIQSARSQRRILVLDDEIVVAAAGLLFRAGLLDGLPVRIGGVGGVMTDPARQKTGLGRIAMESIERAMNDHLGIEFGMLFCEPKNIGFYHNLGWGIFRGNVYIRQDSGHQNYDIMQAMVLPVQGAAPSHGLIDSVDCHGDVPEISTDHRCGAVTGLAASGNESGKADICRRAPPLTALAPLVAIQEPFGRS